MTKLDNEIQKYHNENTPSGSLSPYLNDIEHIGKESNNLEESEVIGVSDDDYVIYDNKSEQKIADVIKNMTTKDARHIGLSKRHLFRLKKRIKEGKKIALERKTLKKLSDV